MHKSFKNIIIYVIFANFNNIIEKIKYISLICQFDEYEYENE